MLAVPAVLPESRHLHFSCGITVQLGFAAEFSNIMIIYTRILAAPRDITECVAKLTDIPEVGQGADALGRAVTGGVPVGCGFFKVAHHPWQELDVDLKCTNRESPEEVGSPLSPSWSPGCPSCCLYSRLCGLQKLRVRLTMNVKG